MAQSKRLGKARRPAPNQPSATAERLQPRAGGGSLSPAQALRGPQIAWLLLALCVAGLVALQPASGDDLWWQLSRGRQVLLGSVHPSADLLTLETNWEADWLGGVPGYLLYGSLGASGLMLARVGIVIGMALRFMSQPTGAEHPTRRWWAILTGGVALLAISPALDPLPAVFDLVAVVILWTRLNSMQPHPRHHLLALGLMFLAWSNLSSGVGLGAGLLLLSALASTLSGRNEELRSRWLDLLVALAAGSLNPRGVWAWLDSARMLLPAASVSPAVLEQTPWVPLPRAAWEFAEYAFFGLTLLWIGRCWWSVRGEKRAARLDAQGRLAPEGRAGRRARSLQFLLVQIFAWFSAANVPLAIAWLACDLVGRWRLPAEGADASDAAAIDSSAAEATTSRADDGNRNAGGRPPADPLWGQALLAAGLGIAVLFSGRLDSFGWGIDSGLDYRLLEIALAETTPHGTAFADDIRSGGMLVWTLPPNRTVSLSGEGDPLRLQDHPSRALAGGRLADHQQLIEDLRFGRQTRYWREDRSPGGFWLTLQFRNTSLICISSEDFELVRGLEPTIWKPLSLDSPVIPYARAGDAAYVEQLLAVLRYRQLVDLEPWNYEVPPSSDSAFDRDWLGLRESAASEATVLRQARTIRAMKLHYAALRVLFVGRRLWPENPQLKEEVRQCQAELAQLERRVAGQASWLRDWAAQSSDPEQIEPRDPPRLGRPNRLNRARLPGDPDSPPEHGHAEMEESRERAELLGQIQEYLRAGPQAALEAARQASTGPAHIPQHPQLAYAWLCWALESGAHDFARELGRELTARSLPPNLHLLVQHRMEDLGPLSEESEL